MFSISKDKLTNDLLIRNELVGFVESQYKDHPARVVQELSVCNGNARIDVAAINGIMHGFEIKSDVDSLQRLSQQVDFYNSVFDKLTLVVGASHLYEAFTMVPEWWGVMVARTDEHDKIYFNTIRDSQLNEQVKLKEIASLLWKEEALDVLSSAGIDRGYRSKTHGQICEKLSEELDRVSLSQFVRESLFNRPNWKVAA